MIRIWIFLFPLFVFASTDQGSVLLLNDSSFILTATIQASDGTFLGQFSIQPGQQKNFTSSLNPTGYKRPGAPNTSLTPYTVIWQCPSEGYYSMCATVSPGSLCKANDCPGNHFCSPKPESKKQAPASTLKKTK